jgi:membrane protease YdiL (CAAX protease family)
MLVGPLAIGCLLAPWVYAGLLALGVPGMSDLAGDRFERTTARVVQIVALLLVWPCMKWSGTADQLGPALRWTRGRFRSFLLWAGIGILSMGALYASGALGHFHFLDPKRHGAPDFLLMPLYFTIGALLVGTLEELFFRGFLFGSLRARLPALLAAALSSVVFSALHFMKPRLPEPLPDITWWSGYALLPHLFSTFRADQDWPFALTLFFMGLALCGLYRRHRHLCGVAGLHAGWVWVLQTADYLLDRSKLVSSAWYGPGDLISRGYLAVLVAALFAALAWRAPPGEDPQPGLDAPAPHRLPQQP